MAHNNLEQFSKSLPSLIFCSPWIARELLQYLVHAMAELALLIFPGMGGGTEGNCSVWVFCHRSHWSIWQITSAGVWDCIHTQGNLVKLFTRRKVEKVVQPGEGKAFGRPSSTFHYQGRGYKRAWSRTLNKELQRKMALNWESAGFY